MSAKLHMEAELLPFYTNSFLMLIISTKQSLYIRAFWRFFHLLPLKKYHKTAIRRFLMHQNSFFPTGTSLMVYREPVESRQTRFHMTITVVLSEKPPAFY